MHIWEHKGLGKAPFTVVGFCSFNPELFDWFELETNDQTLTADDYSLGSCSVCGVRLVNHYFIDSADGNHFSVGCDCVQSSDDRGLIADIKKSKRTLLQVQRANKKRIEREKTLVRFYNNDHQELCITLFAYNGTNNFIKDMAKQLTTYGQLSESQVACIPAAIERDKKWQAEKLKADPVPITDERIEITGVIVSFKEQFDYYGTTVKALIKDNRGFTVYGTMNQGNKGDSITFTARITPSKKDKTFGFFKRPTKIVIG